MIKGRKSKGRVKMAKDLRHFLDRMRKDYPQGVITITEDKGTLKPCECECSALLTQLEQMNKWPSAVFENVSTLSGDRWPGKIIFSELSNWGNAAVMVDASPVSATPGEILNVLFQRGKSTRKWTVVQRKDAPVKEIIWKDDEADLLRLPAYRKDEGDARPGWLCGIGIVKDLERERYNCSWHRHHIHDSKKSSARVNPRHLHEIMNRYRQAGYEEIPIGWVFGHHPAFLLACGIPVGWDIDEYEFAGGLLGESLRLVSSETLGEDFLLPADAEVVVEGFLHLTEKDFNGPWSDVMLYYSPQTLEPVFRPTAITMRRNPIFSESWVGHDLFPQLDTLTQLQFLLSQKFTRVKAVNLVAPYTYVIQFKPNSPGEVNRLAAYAMGGLGNFAKNIIVVDEDIDPFDLSMVLYSVATRVDPSTNRIQIVKDLLPDRQDPSMESNVVGGLIVDSTKPVNKPFPEIGSPPREVVEKLKIHDFVTREEIAKVPVGRKL
jgi:2,5-furandicarboxylate decarboxylase 1